jgi:putative ABC transport system ATP-binding protein
MQSISCACGKPAFSVARIAYFKFGAKAQHLRGSWPIFVVATAISNFFESTHGPGRISFKNRTTHHMSTTSLIPNQPTQMSAGNGSAPLIRLTDVRKIFLTDEVETHAVSGVHLDIHDGEYVSIAGPSGCGKTTLLSILGLLDTPSAGSYALKGTEVANLSFAERARIRNREIGFIFQSFNLIGDLTVYENVELPLTYRGLSAIQRKTAVIDALERVGMAHRAKHLPGQLSGGQQQRVAVARALAGKPAILLADEPTGNLDSRNGEAVMVLLKELHVGGATICMVTHDERFAGHAERAVHLLDGQVVEDRLAA